MTTTLFEDFVNAELPLRIGTVEVTPPTAGKLPVYKGVGLLTEAKTLAEAGIAEVDDLADVATSGSYNDLSDKPTIPTQYTDALVRATALTGISLASGGVISATDTVLGAFGKLQYQLTNFSPVLTEANFSVAQTGQPTYKVTWVLTALTQAWAWTVPNKAINFGDLPSVATTNSNNLSGTNCHILGGSFTTVDGTDNIAIGCKNFVMSGASYTSCTMIGSNTASVSAATKTIMLGMRNVYMQTNPVTGSLFLGASDNPALDTFPVAAATVVNSLYASSNAFPVSGTLYATTNGSQTLSAANCLPIPVALGTAQYEVDFIVSVGTVGLASTSCIAEGCTIMRRIFTVFRLDPTTAYISAVDTVGTDRTLGTIAGTFTPTIALSGTTHVTVGIARAGGVAGQEAMAISARVRAHLTR